MKRDMVVRPGHLLAPEMDYILVDGSSSMSTKWFDVQAALDAYIDTCRGQNLHSHGVVSTFAGSSDIGCIQRDGPIGDWPRFSDVPLVQNQGSTALYDAIALMGRELAHFAPEKCSIVIATDGEEMDSTHTDENQARAILDWCRAQGWQVTFIGADFNNSKQALMLGATEEQCVGVQKRLMGPAGKTLGEKRMKYSRTDQDIGFDGDEKKQFGGYLSGPAA